MSPGWQSKSVQRVLILSHDTSSSWRNFCSVACPKIFSWRILYVEKPFAFKASMIFVLYRIIIVALPWVKYITSVH